MSNTAELIFKIDELIGSLGGLERLRELSRLSSLDHLVNLHLLSHLTKLDRIEGLKELDKLKSLSELSHLRSLDQLENLHQLKVIDEIKSLEKLDNLKELDKLAKLDQLKELDQLSELDKLSALSQLARLESLSQLDRLGELNRLEHLSYLKNLDRLQELTQLTKLDQLKGIQQLLENNREVLSKLKHLEALDNLPLLGQLSQLDKLERLDELKRLDELAAIGLKLDAPPAFQGEATELESSPSRALPENFKIQRSLSEHLLSFGLDLLRTLVLAAGLFFFVTHPNGRKLVNQAVAYLGFGQGIQVNWALETLWNSSPQDFDRYWRDFIKRIESDLDLIVDKRTPYSLKFRYELLLQLGSYEFNYEGQSLSKLVKQKIIGRMTSIETSWMDRINVEIGQLMLRQGDSKKLALWNQLRDLAVGGRWNSLLDISKTNEEDSFAREASIIALLHLHINDPEFLREFFSARVE